MKAKSSASQLRRNAVIQAARQAALTRAAEIERAYAAYKAASLARFASMIELQLACQPEPTKLA